MSKSFEIEYKEYAKNNVPDLWSRIEAGIDSLEAQKTDENIDSDKIVKIENLQTEKSKVQKSFKLSALRKYSGIIVAVAAAAIIIPSILIVKDRTNFTGAPTSYDAAPSYSTEEAMNETAVAETAAVAEEAEEAPSYEMAEEAEQVYEMTEEAVAEEEPAYEAVEAMEEAAPACDMEAAPAESEIRGDDATKATYATNSALKQKRTFAMLQPGDILENIDYVIVSSEDNGLYLLRIENDPNGQLKAGEEIYGAFDSDEEEKIETADIGNDNKVFSATFQYIGDNDVPFVIVEIK